MRRVPASRWCPTTFRSVRFALLASLPLAALGSACGGSVDSSDTGVTSAGGASSVGGASPQGGAGGGQAGQAQGGANGAGAAGSTGGAATGGAAGKGGGTGGGSGQGGGAGASGKGGGAGSAGKGGSGGNPTCNPDNCPGCCDATGTCRPGTAIGACGKGGVACLACDALGFACKAGACEGEKPPCGPVTCASGCCDASGLCQVGTEADACGSGGVACVSCAAMGAGCDAGACKGPPPACGPGTCGGCCDASGACQPGTTSAACGDAGAACATCKGSNVTCIQPGGYCAFLPSCGAATCPTGCCDATGACRVGNENDACGAKGQACSSCTASNQACAPQGFCFAGPHCGSDNCAGCCTLTGECKPGDKADACGEYGALCSDCSGSGSTCKGFACSTGSTCPAPYAGCNPTSSTQPVELSAACDPAELDALAAACAGSPAGPACGPYFQKLLSSNPSCYGCIVQFSGDDAYARCLAAYLSPSCNHALSCAVDCSSTCDGCPDAEADACSSAQYAKGGACAPYVLGYYCAQAAIAGPASFCDFAAAGNDVGKWIRNVAGHYCSK